MKQVTGITYFCLAVLVIGISSAFADDVEILRQQGVKYVSGGVTPEEIKAMQKLAPRFPIQLYFVDKGSDDPISGVKVLMKDIQGDTVLEAKSRGPMFFVEATSGRYTIVAEYGGETISETKDQTGRRYLRVRYRFNE